MTLLSICVMATLLLQNVYCEKGAVRNTRSTKDGRYSLITGGLDNQNSPEDYFPDIEYPSDILQMSRPYYFKPKTDDVLEPFPRFVKKSFKFLSTGERDVSNEFDEYRHTGTPIVKGKKDFLNDMKRQTNELTKKMNAVRLNAKDNRKDNKYVDNNQSTSDLNSYTYDDDNGTTMDEINKEYISYDTISCEKAVHNMKGVDKMFLPDESSSEVNNFTYDELTKTTLESFPTYFTIEN